MSFCPGVLVDKLREHVPIKQGLRRHNGARIYKTSILREHVPIKQGLRLKNSSSVIVMIHLREHVPIKQGLRLSHLFLAISFLVLREHVPIKQGLRHRSCRSNLSGNTTQRACSNKTRIKTSAQRGG